jgi:hypothetical protein
MPPQSNDQPYPDWLRSGQPRAPHGGEPGAAASRSRLERRGTPRRSLLRVAAGAIGVAAAAAVGVGVAVEGGRKSSQQTAASAGFSESSLGPLVVYISDVTTGQFDVFAGTSQVRVNNPAMVAQLLANLTQA